ncbi:MAG: pyridoxal-phosphate dependent enzyme [archaeon]
MKNNVYSGKNAIKDYINPHNHMTPLVELDDKCNPFRKNGIRIFAKLQNTLPLLNIKSIPAYEMINSAHIQKKLQNKPTIIENSSGNTAYSLGIIGRHYGLNSMKAFVSNEVTKNKLNMLRLFGITPIINNEPICPDPDDENSGIYKAKQMAKSEKYINFGQYDNLNNPNSHSLITGKQIWIQTNGKIDIFCSGLGTTGTFLGTSNYLKKKNDNLKAIGVIRKPNNLVPGVRTKNLLKMIAFDWKNNADDIIEIGSVESYTQSLKLIRSGLLVGPSSGFALAGLLEYIKRNKLKNKTCVFICYDTPLPYLDEYFSYLPTSDLPKVINKELLPYEITTKHTKDKVDSITVTKLYKILKETYSEKLNTDIKRNPNNIFIDLRIENKFGDYHIPGFTNIPMDAFIKNYKQKIKKENNIYLICETGEKSFKAAKNLIIEGYNAIHISGGTIAWSNKKYPRIKNEECVFLK